MKKYSQIRESIINENYPTVVMATENLPNFEAKSKCYGNFEGDKNGVVFSCCDHVCFFRLQVYQTVSIIRLQVYHHSFIATVFLVTVAIKDCDKLVV